MIRIVRPDALVTGADPANAFNARASAPTGLRLVRTLVPVVTSVLCPPQIPRMQVCHEHEQWCVDGRHVVREPFRQVDVCHRAALGAVTYGEFGQWAAEPAPGEHERFSGDDGASYADASAGAAGEPGV
ncbi:MAG: hypothetical protein ACRDP9_30565 [Kribbellaceae bacterium]